MNLKDIALFENSARKAEQRSQDLEAESQRLRDLVRHAHGWQGSENGRWW